MTEPKWNYYRTEIAKTGDTDVYRIKVTSDIGESRWMTISKCQRDRIADILAEND